MSWQNKVRLCESDSLRADGKQVEGTLVGKETLQYSIIDKNGQKKGSVQVAVEMSMRPPYPQRHHLMQWDIEGKVVLDERWTS